MKTNKKNKNKPIIKMRIPKDIWDAEHSILNIHFMRKDILRSWMESVKEAIQKTSKNQ